MKKSFRNSFVIALLLIVIISCALSAIPYFFKNYHYKTYKIPSGAMSPSIEMGDYLFVEIIPKDEEISRGDIIVFQWPKDRRKNFIKRVVGLPGEVLEIKSKALLINGQPLQENYVVHHDPAFRAQRDDFGPMTIPEKHVFVLGDNRDQSNDSRFWGCVERSLIESKARMIYWSWDKASKKIRWNRLGKKIN